MNTTFPMINAPRVHKDQTGVALVISLVLLVVVTLTGLAGIQSTTLQERMSSNMYDRSIAMQGAEAALRAAEAAISASATYNNRDCSGEDGTPIQCEPAPPSTFTGGTDTGIAWIDVTSTFQTNAALATGTAQYHIQYLGQGTSVDELGLGNSANFMQYGAGGGVPQANYYQVIVRSHAPDPNSDIDDSRAIVVLSAGYRRNI